MKDASQYPISQKFGYDPTYPLNNGFHQGTDYGCSVGTPVVVNGVQIGLSGQTGSACRGPHCHVGKFTPAGTVEDSTDQGWHFRLAKVVSVSSDPVNGNFVRIYADGNYFVYLHLSEQTCSVGQTLVPPAAQQVVTEDRGIMNEEDAKEVYRATLHREPENDEVWRGFVGKRFSDVSKGIRGSTEWLTQNHVLLNAFPNDERKIGELAQEIAADEAAIHKPIYERFAVAMNVQAKAGAVLWGLDFVDAADAEQNHKLAVLTTGQKFTAVGKATRFDLPDRPVYFMSAESFGEADTTGQPTFNQGVKTIDLEPATADATEASSPEPATTPSALDGDKIAVKVVPPNPEGWKATFKTNSAGSYTALASITIHDLAGVEPDLQLQKGATVVIAGKFTGPDGIEYYRTERSAEGWTNDDGSKHAPNWRGIPVASLEDDDSIFTFKDDLIDDFKDLKGYVGTRRKAILKAAAADGKALRLLDKLKKRN